MSVEFVATQNRVETTLFKYNNSFYVYIQVLVDNYWVNIVLIDNTLNTIDHATLSLCFVTTDSGLISNVSLCACVCIPSFYTHLGTGNEEVLNQVDLPILDDEVCQEHWPEYLVETELCAGHENAGKDFCWVRKPYINNNIKPNTNTHNTTWWF